MTSIRHRRPHHDSLLEHGDWVRAFCRHLVGGDDGEDLAQDTWIVALRSRPIGLESSRAWLAAIARRVASNRYRAERRRLARVREARQPEAVTPVDDLVARSELARMVVDEVLALGEPMRETVLLRYTEGLEPSEIAARLDVPASTVRSRLQRGLERVKEALDRKHDRRHSAWAMLLVPLEQPQRSRGALLPAALVASVVPIAAVLALPLAATASSPLAPTVEQRAAPWEEVMLSRPVDSTRVAVEESPAAQQASEGALRAPRIRWHVAESASGAALVVGERLYAVGKRVRCLAVDDGSEIWDAPPSGLGGWWAGPPVLDGKRLLVTHSTGGVAAFSASDGELLWTVDPLDGRAVGAPGTVVSAAEGRRLLVLGAKDGAVALDSATGAVAWRARLGAQAHMIPALAGEMVLLGTERGVFVGLDAGTGDVRWQVDGLGEFGWTDPVVRDGVCYVGDRGLRVAESAAHETRLAAGTRGALNAFSVADGELLWSTSFGATGFSTPFVGESDVWAGFGVLCAPFDRESGALDRGRAVRTGRNAFGSPRLLGDELVFGNLDGHLYVHDVQSRELLWALALEGEDLQVMDWTASDGTWFVVTTLGLFALEDTPGAPRPDRGHRLVPTVAELEPAPEEEGPEVLGEVWEDGPYFEDGRVLAHRWSGVLVPGRDSESGAVDVSLIDSERAAEVLVAMERGLRDGPPTRMSAALWAAASSYGSPGLERLRPFVAELGRTGPPELRIAALRALYAVGPPEGATHSVDLPLVHAAFDVVDAGDRLSLPLLMSSFGAGVVDGRSADILLEMLEEPVRAELYQWLNGLWGANLRDDLSARLVELARGEDSRMAYDIMYYALSTLEGKSRGVVDLLLDAVEREDHNWSHRAMWGLGHGVPQGLRAHVADSLSARVPGLSKPLAEQAREVIARYR